MLGTCLAKHYFLKSFCQELFQNQWLIKKKRISKLNKKKLVPFLVARQRTENTLRSPFLPIN